MNTESVSTTHRGKKAGGVNFWELPPILCFDEVVWLRKGFLSSESLGEVLIGDSRRNSETVPLSVPLKKEELYKPLTVKDS